MTSIAANPVVSASGQPLAPARVSSDPGTQPTLTRDRAFTSFASAILAALGTAGTTTDPGASPDGAGGRVGDVALALKNALESPSATGDVVGSLISTVRSALAQAGRALGDAGYSSDAIRAFATQFSNALSDRLNVLANQATAGSPAATAAATSNPPAVTPPPAASAPPVVATPAPVTTAATTPVTAPTSTAGSGAFEADYRVTESGTLELVTTQGDVVRIGFRNSTGGSVIGATATGAAGLAAYASVGSYASSRFSVSVHGSLNADELKAVNDVLGQVNTLATQFFSGNLAQAFASAATLGADPTEIAGLALHLTERTSLSLASVGDGSTPPAADPAAASTAPAAAITAPATSAADATSSDATPAATTSAATAPAATTSAGGGTTSLFDYLRQVLDALGTATMSGSVRFSAKAKLELLASTVSAASITPQEATAAGVLKRIAAATTDGASTAAATATGTASA